MRHDIPFTTIKAVTFVLLLGGILAVLNGCSRHEAKNRHLSAAERYFKSGDYESARIEYLNVLRADPSNAVATASLGNLFFDEGEFLPAGPLIRRAVDLDPLNHTIRSKLAALYLMSGNTTNASEESLKVLESEPSNEEALLVLANSARTKAEVAAVRSKVQAIESRFGARPALKMALGSLSFREQDYRSSEALYKSAIQLDPKHGSAHLGLGNLYWSQGNVKLAEAEFRIAAELLPNEGRTQLRWAEFKLGNGSFSEGKAILEKTTQQLPFYIPAWLTLARLNLSEKHYSECDTILQRLRKIAPVDLEARSLHAQLLLAKGEFPSAVTELEELVRQFPTSPQFHYQLALAYLLNRDVERALGDLRLAVGLNPDFADAMLVLQQLELRRGNTRQAIPTLEQLVKKDQGLQRAQLLLAEAYRIAGRTNDVLQVYRGMTASFPKDPYAHFLLGTALRDMNKLDESRGCFGKAMELAPDYFLALEQLTTIDVSQKDYRAAEARLTDKIAMFPKAPEPWFMLSQVRMAQGKTNETEQALLKAVTIQPDYVRAYAGLARFYLTTRQEEKALQNLGAVLVRTPNDLASLILGGMIHDGRKEYKQAADLYEKALIINPTSRVALNNLAYSYAEHLGQLERAHELARRGRDLAPNDPFTADTFGWILLLRGEYAWALNLFEEAAQKLPGQKEILYHLGMAHYMMGNAPAARDALLRAVAGDADLAGREEAKRRLEVLKIDPRSAGPKEVDTLQSRIAKDGRDVIAQLQMAEINERKSKFQDAKECYEAILKFNPKSVTANMRLAQLYAVPLNDSKRAIERARIARDLAPTDPVVGALVGRLALDAGDYLWSRSLLEEAASKLPDDGETALKYGQSLFYNGQVSQAIAVLQRVQKMSLSPAIKAEGAAFLWVVQMYQDPNAAAMAEASVEKLSRDRPDFLPAGLLMAQTEKRRNRPDQARRRLEDLVAKNAGFLPAQKELALLYAAQFKNLDEAFRLGMKLRDTLKGDADIAKMLGMIAYARGDYNYANQLLEEAAKGRPNDGEVLYHLGMSQYQLKRFAASKLSLTRAVSASGASSYVEQARKTLAELK